MFPPEITTAMYMYVSECMFVGRVDGVDILV
jgi:hypothetical protein